MKLQNWSRGIYLFFKEHILSLGLFLAILVILVVGLHTAQAESDAEGLRIAQDSIRRSIVSCYAIEGIYPADLDYLKTNYGLSIDESKYYVQYVVFASNIMPDVTVMEVRP
ncbi:MAG: hypothetical protein R3Y62_00810 [Eubacteriales bacterium]